LAHSLCGRCRGLADLGRRCERLRAGRVRHLRAPRHPVIAVVGNDASWAQIAREQVKMFKDDVATVLAARTTTRSRRVRRCWSRRPRTRRWKPCCARHARSRAAAGRCWSTSGSTAPTSRGIDLDVIGWRGASTVRGQLAIRLGSLASAMRRGLLAVTVSPTSRSASCTRARPAVAAPTLLEAVSTASESRGFARRSGTARWPRPAGPADRRWPAMP